MKRALRFLTGAALGTALLAGCDATTSPESAQTPSPSSAMAELGVAFDDFDRAYEALAPAVKADDEAVVALLEETLARHFGDAAPSVKTDGGSDERGQDTFGPFNISFGQQQTRFGTLSAVYPNDFDVYLYNVTGTRRGEFEGRMEREGAVVGAQLRINGDIVDQDTHEDNITVERTITAPARALVGVAFITPPPGGFPAQYEHRVEFQNPD